MARIHIPERHTHKLTIIRSVSGNILAVSSSDHKVLLLCFLLVRTSILTIVFLILVVESIFGHV